MKKSLQEIEDSYIERGFRDERLRKVLSKDKEWQKLLKEKKNKRKTKLKITFKDSKKYVLATDIDIEILGTCKKLEKKHLNKEDKKVVELIKSQLKDEWRTPLTKYLNKLTKKYKK
ncbi:hypothetical protein HOD29_06295 [archaeon]|jgi:hypothetical protein|nr:hypothetical protein [archaeon]